MMIRLSIISALVLIIPVSFAADNCSPYVCSDGTQAARCSDDGYVINYFAAPCHNHGGDLPTITSALLSPDLNTAIVTLSQESNVKVHIRYDIYSDEWGTSNIGGGWNAFTQVSVQNGFKENLESLAPGTKKFHINFRICPYNEPYTGMHTDKYCTEPFTVPVLNDPNASFPDVPPSHSNAEAITYFKTQGLLKGYADGTFRPDQSINRAEFLKIVMGAFPEHPLCQLEEDAFSDTHTSDWYSTYLCGALQAGVVDGYPDGTFRPGADINFVEAAKIIESSTSMAAESPNAKSDPWYKMHVQYLAGNSAIPLSISSLDQFITRGEMAEIMYRLEIGNLNKPSKTYEQLEAVHSMQWSTYQNLTVGYTFQYPEGAGILSNTFAVWDDVCAVAVHVGPLNITVNTPGSESTEYERYLHMLLEERVRTLWEENKKEIGEHGKEVGPLETRTVNGHEAYGFWTTSTIASFGGGWMWDASASDPDAAKGHVLFFDDGSLKYELSYQDKDAATVDYMLSTWNDSPPLYKAASLYETAQKCQKARM